MAVNIKKKLLCKFMHNIHFYSKNLLKKVGGVCDTQEFEISAIAKRTIIQ